jgi:hypothetical protein
MLSSTRIFAFERHEAQAGHLTVPEAARKLGTVGRCAFLEWW